MTSLQNKSPHSGRMWENTDQKSSENGHFLRSASILDLFPSYILVHSYPN